MRIVVLDGHTMNPGDMSWDDLRALGPCAIHDRTPPGEVLPRAAGAEIILTNKVVLGRREIEALPALRYIGVLATGYNVVDTAAARQRGIIVTNVPAYSTMSVAQVVFAHLLELTHHVGHHSQEVRAGRWVGCPDFAWWDYPLVELAGLVMGLVGFGRTGQAVARVARAFDMHVIVHTRTPPCATGGLSTSAPRATGGLPTSAPRATGGMPTSAPCATGGSSTSTGEADVRFVDLETVFRESDVVSLHCPLTDQTRGLVNAERLALMKPTAYLINTSRGPVVDEQALADALNSGRLAGAGVDVLTTEPPRPENPLLAARNCFITPHFAWASQAARRRLLSAVLENIKAFLAGRPQNVVS